MSILSSNALPRDNGVLYHSISLFFNKTLSESRYRRLPEKEGFKFMELPAEIRNMIWELTIEQRLDPRNGAFPYSNFWWQVKVAILRSDNSTHLPRLKKVRMGHYELAFNHMGTFAPVYFNFKLDILYPRASCSKEQLRLLTKYMYKRDCDRVTYLAMYNEHLERTRSLSTWKALPIRFPNLDTFIVLFKSFVDPKTVDENTLPPCKYNRVWVPSRVQQKYTPTGRRNPAWVQHDRKVLEERTRAHLQPPIHWCQKNKQQKGHSRRTHLLGGKVMRRDPMHSHDWAMEKAQRYRKNLCEAASGTQGVCWGAKLSVSGFCEHGLEFEEAPGLAYKGKVFRHFDDNHEAIKKFYEPGTVTGTVKDQKEAERRARREARKEAKKKAKKKAEREAEKRAEKRDWFRH
ncbi:hypothetical protein BOTNAR_0076g00110 [Botryotinia narcissicola]|uniref:2EXR domain-containing protein n=1 Tax=Botryotinia narcissicola TaxID=278944 RepID=A0A4Z1J9J3_9HELO|nr:hypothetical protein BOTNAR_0076g00110 [Botryotinia narcissicola]